MTALSIIILLLASATAARAVTSTNAIRAELDRVATSVARDRSLLPAGLLRTMIDIENGRAGSPNSHAAIASFVCYGHHRDAQLNRLAARTRRHEPVFRVADGEAITLLVGVDELSAARAVARLGETLLDADTMVVDAAVLLLEHGEPLRGDWYSALVERRRAIQDFTDVAAPVPLRSA